MKSFLDVIVLSILRRESVHGYGILEIIYKQYSVLLSPGTLYPLLYGLEKEGLIETRKEGRRKNYVLTRKGEERTDRILTLYHANISNLLRSIK